MAVSIHDIGKAVLDTQYAVRGPLVARAQELEKAGPAHHLLQHRQPAGARTDAALMDPTAPGALRISRACKQGPWCLSGRSRRSRQANY